MHSITSLPEYVYKLWAFLWKLILQMWETPLNKLLASAFWTGSAGGAATTTEQPLEASQVRTKAEDLMREVTNWGIYTYIWNSSQHHLHPYQPDQILKHIILPKHMEWTYGKKDTRSLS